MKAYADIGRPLVIELEDASDRVEAVPNQEGVCAVCGRRIQFDFSVTDRFWKQVMGDKPKDLRLDMICISCFDRFCREKGILDWGEHLRAVYYVAPTFTVQLKPTFLVLKLRDMRSLMPRGKMGAKRREEWR